MKDLIIYKSKNKGTGGEIDKTSNRDIFKTSESACLYVVNEGLKNKRILKIYATSMSDIYIGIVRDENNKPTINTLSPIGTLPELVFESYETVVDFILEPNCFFNIWVYPKDTSDNISERNVSIAVEYVNEY